MSVGDVSSRRRWINRLGSGCVMVSLTSACWIFGGGGVADVVATVEGRIDLPEDESLGTSFECQLDLFHQGHTDVFRSTKVQGQFEQNYGLPPGRYYFVVTCDGYLPFRSQVYNIKDVRYMRNPIDLGVLTFR
jgi:hypothetical protein